MIHFFHIACENINGVNVAFDTSRCTVHLLEVDNNPHATHAAAALPLIQQQVWERIESYALDTGKELRWLLYDREGSVSEYRDGTLINIGLNDSQVHEPFCKKMSIRRIGSRIAH